MKTLNSLPKLNSVKENLNQINNYKSVKEILKEKPGNNQAKRHRTIIKEDITEQDFFEILDRASKPISKIKSDLEIV